MGQLQPFKLPHFQFLGFSDELSELTARAMIDYVLARTRAQMPDKKIIIQTDNGVEFSGTARHYETAYFSQQLGLYGAKHVFILPKMCEDIRIINALKASMHRALWGEVIPSLRKIILRWCPEKKEAVFTFYHHGEIADAIENHYASIFTEVHADFPLEYFEVDYEIERCDYPVLLSKEGYPVYLRKEPFEDPK